MKLRQIKNIIFDVGNVLVRWAPDEIVRLTFGDGSDVDALTRLMFHSDIWLRLNKGELSERQAGQEYQGRLDYSKETFDAFFYYVKHTQVLLFGMIDLLERVKASGYRVYALTDNVIEIVDYLQSTYQLWDLFDGVIVSAEVGCLKPHADIFNHLLTQYSLRAEDSVFIDDVLANVEGARGCGFKVVHFKNVVQCKHALNALNVELDGERG